MDTFSTCSDADVIQSAVYEWRFIEATFISDAFATMNCVLHFIRHAETVYNQENLVSGQADIPLTSDGISQAAEIGKRLRGASYRRVFCSDLSRARATMEVALSQIGNQGPFDVIFDERLRERRLGNLEGQPQRYIKEYAQGNLDFAPRGGESYRELAQRCASFLIDVRNSEINLSEQLNLLIVTHMGPMRVFEAFFRNVTSAKEMMDSNFKNTFLAEYNWPSAHLPQFMVTQWT